MQFLYNVRDSHHASMQQWCQPHQRRKPSKMGMVAKPSEAGTGLGPAGTACTAIRLRGLRRRAMARGLLASAYP